MEWNDVYDENRNLTGKVHRRGTPWEEGEYGLANVAPTVATIFGLQAPECWEASMI